MAKNQPLKVNKTSSGQSQGLASFLLISPTILLIIIIALLPALSLFIISLYRNLILFHIQYFVGFKNYIYLLQDYRFWSAFLNNLYYTGCSVISELILGFIFALFVNQQFRGRTFVKISILLPWIFPTVVVAKFWGLIFNSENGILNQVLVYFHILERNYNWFGNTFWAMHIAIIADIWKYTPYMSLLLLAGLKSIPDNLWEAAKVDGANTFNTLIKIIIPAMLPSIIIAVLFRTMDSFSTFSILYVLTGGGPADSTEILSIYAFKTLFETLEFGYGSAISVVIFICVMMISSLYIYSFKTRTS